MGRKMATQQPQPLSPEMRPRRALTGACAPVCSFYLYPALEALSTCAPPRRLRRPHVVALSQTRTAPEAAPPVPTRATMRPRSLLLAVRGIAVPRRGLAPRAAPTGVAPPVAWHTAASPNGRQQPGLLPSPPLAERSRRARHPRAGLRSPFWRRRGPAPPPVPRPPGWHPRWRGAQLRRQTAG